MLTSDSLLSDVESELKLLLGSLGDLFNPYVDISGLETARALVDARGSQGASADEYVRRCGLALELLDLATDPDLSPPEGRRKESIMIADHLMAHAIEQVVPLEEPRVIGILAACIAGIAADRAQGSAREVYRGRLFEAARSLGSLPVQAANRSSNVGLRK